jgi:hypothetical protein
MKASPGAPNGLLTGGRLGVMGSKETASVKRLPLFITGTHPDLASGDVSRFSAYSSLPHLLLCQGLCKKVMEAAPTDFPANGGELEVTSPR